MRWLIDGYNVINRAPKLVSGENDDRQTFLNVLANAAQRSSRDRFTVIFDGQRGGSRSIGAGGVSVIYSSAKETADGTIKRLVNAGMTVVSDDREVCDNATRAGARPMTVQDFVNRLQGGRRRS
jgi:predicted RNA-binding protein with PIN domain